MENKITDEGAKALAVAGNILRKLRYIGFYNNKITDNGLKAILSALNKLSSLRAIDLGKN